MSAVLQALADPPAFVLPPAGQAHTRHFMPDATHMLGMPKRGATTNYSDDAKDKAFDAFAVFEAGAEIVVEWPADLDVRGREVLAELLERLPYLGRAESICLARLLDDVAPMGEGFRCEPLPADAKPRDRANSAPPVRVLAPASPLDLGALTARSTDIRRRGLIDPPGARWVAYERPPDPELPRRTPMLDRPTSTTLRWALSASARPSVRAAVTMADCLRAACMSVFGRFTKGSASPILAGKDHLSRPLTGHGHAHYFALDLDGDGLLDELILWAPTGLGPQEMGALGTLDRLTGYKFVSDFRPARLGLEAFGDVARAAPELVGPSRVWRSHTPFAPPRHAKRRDTWEAHIAKEIRRELAARDLPTAARVTIVRGDWLAHRRHRPREPLEVSRRATGVEIEFDHPVAGPLSLGALSHFGLGLFLPTP